MVVALGPAVHRVVSVLAEDDVAGQASGHRVVISPPCKVRVWKTPELSAIVSAARAAVEDLDVGVGVVGLGPGLPVVGDAVEIDADAERALRVVERVVGAAAADEVVVPVRARLLDEEVLAVAAVLGVVVGSAR